MKNIVLTDMGGVVLKENNMVNLSNNGYILLLLGKIQTIVDNLKIKVLSLTFPLVGYYSY